MSLVSTVRQKASSQLCSCWQQTANARSVVSRSASTSSVLRVRTARRAFASSSSDSSSRLSEYWKSTEEAPSLGASSRPSDEQISSEHDSATAASGSSEVAGPTPYAGLTHTSFPSLQFATKSELSVRRKSQDLSHNRSISSMLAQVPSNLSQGKPYPPPTPRVSDPLLRALALGVNRHVGEVQHRQRIHNMPPGKRSKVIKSDWFLEDNSRLEHVGDGVLWAITRSLVYRAYPDLSAGGIASIVGPLVANDTLQMLWDSSGLEEFRIEAFHVALTQMEERLKADKVAGALKKRAKPSQELPSSKSLNQAASDKASEPQPQLGKETSTASEPSDEGRPTLREAEALIPSLTKHRKADHFEAYVAAVHLDLGPQVVSSWLEELYAPYVARMREHAMLQGQQERWLTHAARARRAEGIRKAAERAERDRKAEQRRAMIAEIRSRKDTDVHVDVEKMGTLRKTLRSVSRSFVGWVWPELKVSEVRSADGPAFTATPATADDATKLAHSAEVPSKARSQIILLRNKRRALKREKAFQRLERKRRRKEEEARRRMHRASN